MENEILTPEFIVNQVDFTTREELLELINKFGDQQWQNGIDVGRESTYDC